MSLAKKERENLDAWNKLLSDIVKNYKCPAECNGACCRECNITLEESEFKRIIKQRKEIKETLEKNALISSEIIVGSEVKQYEFTAHPCPLLSEKGRCSTYNIRPTICRIYPFKVNSSTVPGNISVDACPVGVQIALDFVVFKTIANADPFATSYKIPVDELLHLKQMIEDSKEYITNVEIKLIQITLEFLKPFFDYLKRSKKELVLSDRQVLINKINSHNILTPREVEVKKE